MKIFIITLMLLVLKGFETHGLPVESDAAGVEHSPEPVRPLMNIPNFDAIFSNVSANITDIQQKMQVFTSQFEEQANLFKDRLIQMFAEVQEPKPLSESSTSSLAEQIEAFKRNLNEWSKNVIPANTSQLVPENFQENVNQKIKQFHQIFLPLYQRFQGSFIEGIQNLQKSMAPGIQDIKKYITELESA